MSADNFLVIDHDGTEYIVKQGFCSGNPDLGVVYRGDDPQGFLDNGGMCGGPYIVEYGITWTDAAMAARTDDLRSLRETVEILSDDETMAAIAEADDETMDAITEAGACPRCSWFMTDTYHGAGTICDRDPAYVVNVIAEHFKKKNSAYVGIVWEAIGNGVIQALDWRPGDTVTINPDGTVSRKEHNENKG